MSNAGKAAIPRGRTGRDNAVLRMAGVHKTYKAGEGRENVVRAVNGVDLEIRAGESVVIMGPSGSGKSTMLHLLGALDKPSEGEIFVDGEKISGVGEDELANLRSRKIGFVFQAFFLIPTLSVLENVMLPALLAGTDKGKAGEKAAMLLRRVGLERWAGHRATELSGGQKQRVAIARALINSPPIILADEPTGNLDTKTGGEILQLFDELNGEGKTIVTVTHDADIITHANRVVRLKDGKIVEDLKIPKKSAK